MNKSIVLLTFLASCSSLAQAPERISAIHFNKGKVERIYMAPGLATAVTFPCDLDEAVIGRDEDLKAKVSPTSKKQLTLFLSSSASMPTNMIVRCGDRQDLYVFDVVPSRSNHQDVLRISGSYGGAGLKDNHLELIDSDQKRKDSHEEKRSKRRIDPKTVVLQDSSDNYKAPAANKKPSSVVENQTATNYKEESKSVDPTIKVGLTPDLKSLENRRPTVILAEKPQLIEENVRTEQRQELKRVLTESSTDQGGAK